MTRQLPITNPVYASPTEHENEWVWTRVWVCAGVEEQVPQTGDVLPVTVGDYGLHVRREADGGLRASFNILQHGSCQIIPEQCRGGHKTTCPYTACAFSRDSDTISAVDGRPADGARQFIGFNPLKLHDVSVERLGPLLFVSLAGADRPDLHEQVGPLATVIGRSGLGPITYAGRFWTDLDCHWARAGDRVLRALGGSEPGPVSTLPLPPEFVRPGSERATADVYRVFPNLMVVTSRDHTAVLVFKPIAEAAVSAVVSLYRAPDADPAADDELLDRWRALLGEAAAAATAPVPS